MFRSLITTFLILPASSIHMEGDGAQLRNVTMQLVDENDTDAARDQHLQVDAMWLVDPNGPAWTKDGAVTECQGEGCGTGFGLFTWRYHCRFCGKCKCDACAGKQKNLHYFDQNWKKVEDGEERICQSCRDRHAESLTPIKIEILPNEFSDVSIMIDAKPNTTGKELRDLFCETSHAGAARVCKSMKVQVNDRLEDAVQFFFVGHLVPNAQPLSALGIVDATQLEVRYHDQLSDYLKDDHLMKAVVAGNSSEIDVYQSKGACPNRAIVTAAGRGNAAGVKALIPRVDQAARDKAFVEAFSHKETNWPCVYALVDNNDFDRNVVEVALQQAVRCQAVGGKARVENIDFLFGLGATGSQIKPEKFYLSNHNDVVGVIMQLA